MVLVSDKTDRRVWGTCAGLTRVSDSLSESALILSWPGLTLLLPFLPSPRPLLSLVTRCIGVDTIHPSNIFSDFLIISLIY